MMRIDNELLHTGSNQMIKANVIRRFPKIG